MFLSISKVSSILQYVFRILVTIKSTSKNVGTKNGQFWIYFTRFFIVLKFLFTRLLLCKIVMIWLSYYVKLYIRTRIRSSHRSCSVKKVFLEISQNSQKSTWARVSFLIKLQTWPGVSGEFCKISKNTFLQNTSKRLFLLNIWL